MVDRSGMNRATCRMATRTQVLNPHLPVHSSSLPRTMAAKVFTKDWIGVRSFKSDPCVQEDEWTLFTSKMCVLMCRRRRRLMLGQVLHLSYTLENEPFEKLPVLYRPIQGRGHNPPRLSLGFAIRKEFAEFHRVALKEGLADPKDINYTIRFSKLTGLILGHLNEICGLPSGEGMTTQWIHSREGIVVIELSRGGISRMILTKKHRTNISSRVSRPCPATIWQIF